MLRSDYTYGTYINERCPLAPQPEKIQIPLKPHQRASLHKAMLMESNGEIMYNVPHTSLTSMSRSTRNGNEHHFFGKFKIQTNIGILGDAIGSGKTILALSIVAATPIGDLHQQTKTIHSFQGRTGSYMRVTMDCRAREPNTFLKTTLIVVPRGPVYSQFVAAIQSQTKLNILCIDCITVIKRLMPAPTSSNEVIKAFIEKFDAVLIKNTALKVLHEYYSNRPDLPIFGWERIIVDEACDILNKIPMYKYSFMWMISATYHHMVHNTYGSRGNLGYSIRDIVISEETMNVLLVKCTDQFITKSFNVPQPIESFYVCELPRQLAAVHSFLSPSVRERIDANDFMGALTLMGASAESENDVVTLITKEIERDIRNKKREIEYIEGLDISPDVKATRLVNPRAELARLEDKLNSLIERVTALEEKSCTVCMDAYENPLLLPCNHIFCSKCLISWMQYNRNTCPTCRSPIHSRQLIAIVKENTHRQSSAGTSRAVEPPVVIKSKEDTLVDIIKSNTTGRFVVFSKLDSSYWGCMSKLRENNIQFGLLRGNSNVMGSVLDRFRTGATRVLLLNTVHAASGIDISCATDLIIIHELGLGRIQAVGRCNRHPRTIPLRIHQLCYPHEMHNRTTTSAEPNTENADGDDTTQDTTQDNAAIVDEANEANEANEDDEANEVDDHMID